MLDKFSTTQSVGIELNYDELLCAQASYSSGTVRLLNRQKIAVITTTHENGTTQIAYAANTAPLKIENQSIGIVSLKSSDVLVRPLEIKLIKDKDIQAVLPFQAEPLLPYPLESAIINSMKVGSGKDYTLLSLFSTRKEYLKELLQHYDALKINPEIISSVPAALAAFAHFFKTSAGQAAAVFHIGSFESSCVLVRDSKVIASYTLSGGILSFGPPLSSDLNCSENEAIKGLKGKEIEDNASLYPQFAQSLENMALSLAQQLFSLVKQNKSVAVSQVFLTGNAVYLPSLKEKLKKVIGSPITLPAERDGWSTRQLEEFAVPIGLAISALPNAPQAQDFRQQEFSYPHPWQRYKQSLCLYFGACIFAALALWILGNAWSGYREDKVKEEYASVLSSLDMPYGNFEKEFHDKVFHRKIENHEIPNLKDLTQSDLRARLLFLQDQAQKIPETYPLLPNTPRVSDVLAWLSTHGQVVNKGTDKKAEALLNLESFNYQMVKKPDQSKKHEKYQVRVELEFTTTTPKLAREFHDALITPNEIVDPKGEIKWSSNRDSYRTSFFLKDKTTYPPLSGN